MDFEEDEAEDAPLADKWDVIILHGEDQQDLAEAVRDDIRDLDLGGGVHPVVEILEDTIMLGQDIMSARNEAVTRATVLMFFRCKRYFENKLDDFTVSMSMYDRIHHAATTRHGTVLPLDIERQIKINNRPDINQVVGITVSSTGQLGDRQKKKMKNTLRVKLASRCSVRQTDSAGVDRHEPSLAEAQSRQRRDLKNLVECTTVTTSEPVTNTEDSHCSAGSCRPASHQDTSDSKDSNSCRPASHQDTSDSKDSNSCRPASHQDTSNTEHSNSCRSAINQDTSNTEHSNSCRSAINQDTSNTEHSNSCRPARHQDTSNTEHSNSCRPARHQDTSNTEHSNSCRPASHQDTSNTKNSNSCRPARHQDTSDSKAASADQTETGRGADSLKSLNEECKIEPPVNTAVHDPTGNAPCGLTEVNQTRHEAVDQDDLSTLPSSVGPDNEEASLSPASHPPDHANTNQDHTHTNQQHTDTNQDHTHTNQDHTDTNQDHTDTNQEHTDTNHEHTDRASPQCRHVPHHPPHQSQDFSRLQPASDEPHDQHLVQSFPRHYWDQKGARPKGSPCSAVPPDRGPRNQRLPGPRGTRGIPATASPDDHINTTPLSAIDDESLRDASDMLRQTSLTPPPSPPSKHTDGHETLLLGHHPRHPTPVDIESDGSVSAPTLDPFGRHHAPPDDIQCDGSVCAPTAPDPPGGQGVAGSSATRSARPLSMVDRGPLDSCAARGPSGPQRQRQTTQDVPACHQGQQAQDVPACHQGQEQQHDRYGGSRQLEADPTPPEEGFPELGAGQGPPNPNNFRTGSGQGSMSADSGRGTN